MLLEKTQYPDTTIFHLKGRLDASSTEELEHLILVNLEQGMKNLIMDFSELDYINSAGLRILVMSYQRLQPIGGQVAVCGAKDYIAEIFDISGYNRVFSMYPDLDQAMSLCTAAQTGERSKQP
jgi:anti-sigma B factor antagonist